MDHEYWLADGETVVFTNNQSGYGNVYTVTLPPWETLPLLRK